MPEQKKGTQIRTIYTARTVTIFLLILTVFSTLVAAEEESPSPRSAAPTFVQPGRIKLPEPASTKVQDALAYDPERLIAGHLLRRLGFGPTKKELKAATKMGVNAYVNQQLNYQSINDDKALRKLPRIPKDIYEEKDLIRGWNMRMVLSKRQLLEKMTLTWHEHFSVSNEKVEVGGFLYDHENLLRAHALGNFRDMLIDVSKDQAMLIWLDNNRNNGKRVDSNGNPIPPNENYAREFLQLFATGTVLLNLDGTPVTDSNGNSIPAYTETDVREVARALTGWLVPTPYKNNNAAFTSTRHDEGNKTIMGQTLVGRIGTDGANEVADVVNIILQQRTDTVAAFISKILIQKFVTETPPNDYVLRVATAFRDNNFSIKEAVRTIFTDPMFVDPSVIRSQYKVPIEQFIGAIRALKGKTKGSAIIQWMEDTGHAIYYPPSVFSFYSPGNKGALLDTAMVFERDEVADELIRAIKPDKENENENNDTYIIFAKLLGKLHVNVPDEAVDALADMLLAGPLQPEVRTEIINYMAGQVTETKFRGAAWLILCSPDFQRN